MGCRLPPVLLLAAVLVSAGAAEGQKARPQIVQVAPTAVVKIVPQAVRADQSDLRRVFELGPEAGYRELIRFTVGRPGRVAIDAEWKGRRRLALVLNAPGLGSALGRVDGESPLHLEVEANEKQLQVSHDWALSVVDFAKQASTTGRVRLQVPARPLRLAEWSVAASPKLLAQIQGTLALQPPPACEGVERTILPSGEVQSRYPDGRVVIHHSCGQTTIFPDGTVTDMVCNQVQPASLPAPADPGLRAFLENHRDHLLEQIERLVQQRQDQVDLYLQFESSQAPSLYRQIQMRTQLIDTLLQQ